ncbi:unnamed protein product [Lampetra planeri]
MGGSNVEAARPLVHKGKAIAINISRDRGGCDLRRFLAGGLDLQRCGSDRHRSARGARRESQQRASFTQKAPRGDGRQSHQSVGDGKSPKPAGSGGLAPRAAGASERGATRQEKKKSRNVTCTVTPRPARSPNFNSASSLPL